MSIDGMAKQQRLIFKWEYEPKATQLVEGGPLTQRRPKRHCFVQVADITKLSNLSSPLFWWSQTSTRNTRFLLLNEKHQLLQFFLKVWNSKHPLSPQRTTRRNIWSHRYTGNGEGLQPYFLSLHHLSLVGSTMDALFISVRIPL